MDRADWARVDKARFFGVGTGLFCGCTAALYPLFAIKTQAQVSGVGLRVASAEILARGGLRGFWKGLPTVLCAELPVQTVYVVVLELSRGLCRSLGGAAGLGGWQHEGLSGALSGGCASLAAQVFVVPADVISQRQVVSTDGRLGAIAAARRLLRAHGLAGLYRGFPLSCLQYVPASTIWWSSYSTVRHQAREAFPRSSETLGGIAAGLVTASLTQPVDVVRTRLQTQDWLNDGLLFEARRVAKQVWACGGVAGFYYGLGPRAVHSACWGTVMINLYEHLRRFSELQDLRPPPTDKRVVRQLC